MDIRVVERQIVSLRCMKPNKTFHVPRFMKLILFSSTTNYGVERSFRQARNIAIVMS